MDDIIFKYKIDDAWEVPISSITVHNRKGMNVEVKYFSESDYVTGEVPSEAIEFKLDKRTRDRIINAITKSGVLELFEDELETVLSLDGVINTLYFSNHDDDNIFHFYNLENYRNANTVYVAKIIKLFDKIAKILIGAGVDAKSLNLDYKL